MLSCLFEIDVPSTSVHNVMLKERVPVIGQQGYMPPELRGASSAGKSQLALVQLIQRL